MQTATSLERKYPAKTEDKESYLTLGLKNDDANFIKSEIIIN